MAIGEEEDRFKAVAEVREENMLANEEEAIVGSWFWAREEAISSREVRFCSKSSPKAERKKSLLGPGSGLMKQPVKRLSLKQ